MLPVYMTFKDHEKYLLDSIGEYGLIGIGTCIFRINEDEMEAIKYKTIVQHDGIINLTGLPYKKGQEVEMIILIESSGHSKKNENRNFSALTMKTSGFKFQRESANER
jgi:hypothetical protein